jgi:hypothetical protein
LTTKFAKWPSEHRQIIKSGRSNDRSRMFNLTMVKFGGGRIRFEGYLGNVG